LRFRWRRSLPEAVTEADGEIQSFASQIDPVVVGQQPQVDVGMDGCEIVESRQQPTGGEGGNGADRQHFMEASASEPVQAGTDAIECLVEYREQGRAFVSQCHAARQAPEQHDAQPRFQSLDLVAQRGLADAQFQRGAGEIEMSCGRLEGSQGIERKLRTNHQMD
jgi:hypothetical protein